MMSNQMKSKIMEHLAKNPIPEMSNDDLDQLLEAELSKPADEIDASLVEEILDALNAPAPTIEQEEASWETVRAHFPRQAKAHVPQAVLRFGAAAAAVIMMLFVSLRDAEAFRWTLIEKILKPVAETFGIVIDDQESIIPEENESTLYTIEDAPSEYIKYDSLEDVPETAYGYPIRPRWIPKNYVLSTGSLYSTYGSDIYSLDFIHDNRWFNLHINVLTNNDTIYSFEFEQNSESPIEITIGQHPVTIYSNRDDQLLSSFWIHENAHYFLYGNITVDDIVTLIEHME